jgi:hypothetical protein
MNKTDNRMNELEKRLIIIENGLEEMGIMATCKCCKRPLEVDTDKHIKDIGSEPELRGWYCDKTCETLFSDNWSVNKSGNPDI